MTSHSPRDQFATEFENIVRNRRATRVYADEPLDDADVRRLLELSLEAPSAFNIQSRAIVRIEDPEVRQKVVEAAGGQQQVANAPLLLAFIGEPTGWKRGIPRLVEANKAAGLWDEVAAAEREATMTSFHEAREKKGLSREFAIRDAMIAASFAMVTASAFGWASSPMTGFSEQKVKEAIGAGDTDVAVALLLAIGVPGEFPAHPGRFEFEQRAYTDRYEG